MRNFISTLFLFILLTVNAWADTAADQAAASPGALDQFWQDEKASLVLRTDYFENSKTFDGEQNLWGQSAELKAYPLIDSVIDGKFDARVINPNSINGDPTDFELLEGYVNFHLDNLDIRVGKQIVPWGRADGINPTDNLTPHDFTVQLPFDDDMRFGTAALKLDYTFNTEMDLTVFTTPFFEPTKFPLPPTGGFSYNSVLPAQTLNNSEVGVRLNKTGGDWDWSVSYFRGYRLLPDVSLDANNSSQLNINYSQVDVAGLDFAHNLGPYAVRGEVAYLHPTGPNPSDPNQINPYLLAVLGMDRTFDQELNVNVQIIGRFIQNYSAAGGLTDPNLEQVYQLNAILNTLQDPESYEMSFRIGDKWFNETLEADLFGVVDLTRADGYLRPSVDDAINDQIKIYVGWDIYYGSSATPYGLLQPTQGFFSELRYSF